MLGLYCLHMILVVWLLVFGPQEASLLWEITKVPLLLGASLLAYGLLSSNVFTARLVHIR